MTEIRSWLAGRLPQGWFIEAPEVLADRDEILVVGRIEDVASSEVRAPSIDHDHRTGRVRGILCRSCNLRVGWYELAMKRGSVVAAQQLDGFATKIAHYLRVAARGAFGPQ